MVFLALLIGLSHFLSAGIKMCSREEEMATNNFSDSFKLAKKIEAVDSMFLNGKLWKI